MNFDELESNMFERKYMGQLITSSTVSTIKTNLDYLEYKMTSPTLEDAYDIVEMYKQYHDEYQQYLKNLELQKKQQQNASLRGRIKNVVFNKKATIVFWSDGTKTVVKKQKGDKYNKEVGLAMAMAKKFYENTNIFNDEIRKWCN